MAKTRVPTAAHDDPPTGLAAKASAAARRAKDLRADLTAAREMAQQAHVREALTRTELTLALTEALRARAAAEAVTRAQAVKRYLETAKPRGLRPYGRLDRALDRLLLRLGRWGQAQVIARAGIWRNDKSLSIAAYVRRGADPSAQPATLFDQAWYLEACPGIAGSGVAPLAHYLVHGLASRDRPHPLVDPNYYESQNLSSLRANGVSPLEHFLRQGGALGRNPHPVFDIAYYVAQGPRLTAGEDPASHYVRAGWRDGLSPHPLFDPEWYRRQMPRQAAEVPPLIHYLTIGWREGLTPHPLFDPAWYLGQNADVLERGYEPLSHFIMNGAAEGRNPSPWFDVRHYVAARGADLDPAANPLVDYLQGGAWAVGEAKPGFPSAAYLAASPDLARKGMTPLEHWARKAAART